MRVILFLWANIFLSIFNIHLYITQILCVISNTTKGKNMKCIKSLFSFLYRDPEVHLRLIRREKTSLLEWMRLPNPSKLTSLTSLPNYRSRRSLSLAYTNSANYDVNRTLRKLTGSTSDSYFFRWGFNGVSLRWMGLVFPSHFFYSS